MNAKALSRNAVAVLEALKGCERGTAVRRLAWLAGLPEVNARRAMHELEGAGLVWLAPGGSGGRVVHLAAWRTGNAEGSKGSRDDLAA